VQCAGECVIWQESIDEQPWEKVRSSSPLKVKEDDEVDKLEIKINTSKRSRRTYPSPSPEVALKISRSLRVSDDAFLHAEYQTVPYLPICFAIFTYGFLKSLITIAESEC
jgi:hypothetical protein